MSALGLLTRFGLSRQSSTPPGVPQYGITGMPGSPATFSTNAQRGPVYTFSAPVTAVGLRIWKPTTGDDTVRLWRVSDKALLATVTATADANAWVETALDTPIPLAANTQYLVTTRRPGAAAATVHAPAAGFTFHPLVTFEGSRTAESDAYPTGVNANVLGLADLVFLG